MGTRRKFSPRFKAEAVQGSDLSMHTPIELQHVADELNSRPCKCLNWDTPAERQQALLSSTSTSRCND